MNRGILIIVLVIILAGIAYAESAWVLWQRVAPLLHRGEGKWELQKAYPTDEDCMKAKEAEVQSTGAMWKKEQIKVNPGENVIIWDSKKEEYTVFEYKCLPGTIDQRK